MTPDLPSLPESPEARAARLVPAPVLRGPRAPGLVRPPSGELDWRNYVASVARHKRMVGGIVAVGLVLGIVAAMWIEPTYAARANLWAEVHKEGGGNPGPTWSSQLLGSGAWLDLLRSDVIVAEVVRQQRLYLRPKRPGEAAIFAGFALKSQFRPGTYRLEVDSDGSRFALSTGRDVVRQRGAVGDSVGGALGFMWVPPAKALTPGRRIEFEVVSLYEATEELLKNLDIRPGRDRNFIRIELQGSNPVRVAATVNATAARLIAVAAELKREKLTALTAILGEQLHQAEFNLGRAETTYKTFRTRTATLLVPERDVAATSFVGSRTEQEQVRRDREAIAQALAAADSGASIHSLEAVGAVQRAPDLARALQDLTAREADLRALRRRYTDGFPAVRQLTDEVQTLERVTIPSLARGLIADLSMRGGRLDRQVDSASSGLRQISPLAVEDGQLARDVRVAEELFVSLRRRYEEARLADASVTPDVRLLDGASVPETPLYDRGPIAFLLALVGSMGLGVIGAVLTDLVDPKVRYPTQVARELGLPVLGVVPHVGRGDETGRDGVVQVIEALRGVRLNVVHAYGSAGPLLLTVTSPGIGDGKSFVTSNLALAFAEAGYRTLLIDGDIRRGRLHRVFNAPRKPGLTDFLGGQAPREAVIQATTFPGLTFIGCGARRQSGPELLGSPVMARFMASLRPAYDVILVDSSPLAAGVDPYALATLTGHLLLVLRTGVTNREVAGAKLDILGRLPVRVLGAVVNDVRPGIDHQQYSYYLSGYEAVEEGPSGARLRVLQGGERTANGGD